MNPQTIVAIYVIIDDLLNDMGHASDVRAVVSDAEILTGAVLAAKYFGNRHETCLYMLTASGYLSQRLSMSRFNRRVHPLSGWLLLILETLWALATKWEAFIVDSGTSRGNCG